MAGDERRSDGHAMPEAPPPLPRWVKLLALGALVVLVALVLVMLVAGGKHGPGMHGG